MFACWIVVQIGRWNATNETFLFETNREKNKKKILKSNVRASLALNKLKYINFENETVNLFELYFCWNCETPIIQQKKKKNRDRVIESLLGLIRHRTHAQQALNKIYFVCNYNYVSEPFQWRVKRMLANADAHTRARVRLLMDPNRLVFRWYRKIVGRNLLAINIQLCSFFGLYLIGVSTDDVLTFYPKLFILLWYYSVRFCFFPSLFVCWLICLRILHKHRIDSRFFIQLSANTHKFSLNLCKCPEWARV